MAGYCIDKGHMTMAGYYRDEGHMTMAGYCRDKENRNTKTSFV